MRRLPTPRNIATAAGIDVLALVVFVVIGRRSHDEGESATEVLKVFAPFAIALAIGWVATKAWRNAWAPFPTGLWLWLITAAGGLAMRRFVFDRSTAMGFVIVGSVFLMVSLVGWRLVAEWVRERRK